LSLAKGTAVAAPIDIADFNRDRLTLHVAQARQHLRAVRRLLPGLAPLSEEERRCTNTILDDDHADAISAVLDVMEQAPEEFDALPMDPFVWGPDLEGFSVELARELLAMWRTLRPLAQELEQMSSLVSDYLIWVGAPVRDPAGLAGADRALDLAEKDPAVRAALGKSLAYWEEYAPQRMARHVEARNQKR
jgi:hypothetical protein